MSGFNNSNGSAGLSGRNITNDYGRTGFSSGLPVTAVEILPNMNKQAVMKGGERLPQFANEPVQSVDVLISSQNRMNGTNFDFTSDIGSTIFRPRLVSVDAVVLPKMFNITPRNNQIRMQIGCSGTSTGTPAPSLLSFTLPIGGYTPSLFNERFSTAFRVAFRAQAIEGSMLTDWQFLGGFWVFSIDDPQATFDPELTSELDVNTNTFSITFTYSNLSLRYATSLGGPDAGPTTIGLTAWFDETCSFIARGKNFIPFGASPVIDPTIVGYDYPIYRTSSLHAIPSGMAGMVYTRWCTLSSNALNRFSFGESKVSRLGDGGGRGKIIAVLDATYNEIVDGEYAGSFLGIQYPNSAFININNAQGQLEQYLDFTVRDEYGDSLDGIFNNDLDQIGITFWLKVTF